MRLQKFKSKYLLNIKTLEKLSDILEEHKDSILKLSYCSKYFYKEKCISKQNSSEDRILHIPQKKIKKIQNLIYKRIFLRVKLPICAHGGIKGKSIITNAYHHIKKEWVMAIDIKDFFDSIHYSRIYQLFLDLNCEEEVAKIITKLTTFKYTLPQGAPTSPYLSNLVLLNLDEKLINLCKLNHITYTRYFDDLTFSGGKVIKKEKTFQNIVDILKQEGYSINHKTKFQHKSKKQKVCGIIVNKKMRIENDFIENLKNQLLKLEKTGISVLQSDNFMKEKLVILGRINFIKQVNKNLALKFKRKFDKIEWDF